MILNQGYLIKRKAANRQVEKYTMKLVHPMDIDQVVFLQDLVYEGLPNKEVLFKDSKREMLEDLYNGALIIGVYNSVDELISYRYVSFPGNSKKNLGNDILLTNRDLDKVVHLETTLVSPEYRGNRLQSLTLNKAIELIEPMDMRHVMCTVSPFNLFSLYNIMSAGLNIKALKRKYGESQGDGMWRFILHKDLNRDFNTAHQEQHLLRMESLEEQKMLIDQGYVGHHLIRESKLIHYSLAN